MRLRTGGGLLFLLLAYGVCQSVEPEPAPSSCLQCDREMRKVLESFQAWRRAHGGNYPDRLVDLVAAGLMPADGGICPNVRLEAASGSASHQLATSRKAGADPSGTYEYELTPNDNRAQAESLWVAPGTPPYTRRDIKLTLLRRAHSDQVPILRCSSHTAEAPAEFRNSDRPPAFRNVTASGDVYWSDTYWATRWLADVPYCARASAVLFGIKGPPFYVDKAPELPTALDLRPWSCAFGDDAWWWPVQLFDELQNSQFPAHLRPFFQQSHGRVVRVGGEDYWLNGLAQLQGKISLKDQDRYSQSDQESFVWERTGLPVTRKFRKASWLQGTVWTAPLSDLVGLLIWHYADGSSERVPIIYGKTTARFWGDVQQVNAESAFPEPVWKHHEAEQKLIKERWLRLYQQTWDNPHPDRIVSNLDFVSNRNSPAAPFIIAIDLLP